MQADREDRYSSGAAQGRHNTQTIVTGIAVLILAAGAYLLMPKDSQEAADTPTTVEPSTTPPIEQPAPPQPEPADAISAAPDIPEEPVEEPEPITPSEEPEPVAPPPPPPTPEELDALLRKGLAESELRVPTALESAVAAPYLLDRGVSSMDQLARGLVPRRTLNLARPVGTFSTRRDGQRYRVDPAGYARYDSLTSAIASLPPDTLAALFQRFRPQLRDAYGSLGYPADAMDNTLIAALDAVIAAPTVDTPPALVSKGALWAYEDTTLEGRSELEKQLLRTGPDNTRKLQQWASELREALLGEAP